MPESAPDLDLRCSACGWSEHCPPKVMLRWLQEAGMLRRNASASAAELRELLLATVSRLTCPECSSIGLHVARAAEDDIDWPGERRCEVCQKPIDAERLEALPHTRLCTTCQQGEERGGPLSEDYCPRCGAPMIVRRAGGSGITRYEQVCSAWPACRGRG
jgi:predicted RNA-binding Zn-ribbon protein involved in translation (DUF1610 family)